MLHTNALFCNKFMFIVHCHVTKSKTIRCTTVKTKDQITKNKLCIEYVTLA